MANTPKFIDGYRKFAFAVFTVIVSSIMCWLLKYDGEIFKTIVIGLGSVYLASQAAVDWKANA